MCRSALYWDAEHVARLMRCRNIPNRLALAKVLKRPRTTVYKAFNEDWSGGVSVEILAAISVTFDVPIHWLVRDPRGQR